jgi:hypothetical protein
MSLLRRHRGLAPRPRPRRVAADATRLDRQLFWGASRVDDPEQQGLERRGKYRGTHQSLRESDEPPPDVCPGLLGNPDSNGRQPERGGTDEPPQPDAGRASSGFWSAFELVPCQGGKVRRVEPGTFPLAPRVPRDVGRVQPTLAGMVRSASLNRIGRLRGYGNAIVPPLAAEFIRAFVGAMEDMGSH